MSSPPHNCDVPGTVSMPCGWGQKVGQRGGLSVPQRMRRPGVYKEGQSKRGCSTHCMPAMYESGNVHYGWSQRVGQRGGRHTREIRNSTGPCLPVSATASFATSSTAVHSAITYMVTMCTQGGRGEGQLFLPARNNLVVDVGTAVWTEPIHLPQRYEGMGSCPHFRNMSGRSVVDSTREVNRDFADGRWPGLRHRTHDNPDCPAHVTMDPATRYVICSGELHKPLE